MCVGEASEVSFATPTGPLSEDRQRQDLALGEQHRAATTTGARRMRCLPPVVHQNVERDQEGVEIQPAYPTAAVADSCPRFAAWLAR